MRTPLLPAPSVAQRTEGRWIYPAQRTVCQKNHQENDHSSKRKKGMIDRKTSGTKFKVLQKISAE